MFDNIKRKMYKKMFVVDDRYSRNDSNLLVP